MPATTYASATDFLRDNQADLEREEIANGLMLGICLRLARSAQAYGEAPYLAAVRDAAGLAAAAIMTPPHKLIVYGGRPDCREALAAIAEDLIQRCIAVPGVLGPSLVAEAFAEVWAALSGHSAAEGMRQRVYALRRVMHPRYSPGRLRAASEGDLDLLARWILAFQQEALGSGDIDAHGEAERRVQEQSIYLWDDGRPASMAAHTRPTGHGIAVGPVYTPPELRRQGYATSCVAALSQRLLDSGREFCTLFANLANPTANGIYQQIGYTPVCDYQEYVFQAPVEGAGGR